MSAHPPPVPPDQRPKIGPADSHSDAAAPEGVRGPRDPNLAEQGRQGNIQQNTTNTGYQQDR
ncbi:MAG: hypothetical protein JO326_07470 [Acetobacteraceae bacterium]|nr:hypothetical protein [Acetobacteraceae bacterium]